MGKRFCAYLLMLAATLAAFPSCGKAGADRDGDDKEGAVQLAVSIGSASRSKTKGNAAVITEMADNVGFRGMTGVTILPFDVSGEIAAEDRSLNSPSRLSDISQYFYNRAVGSGGVYVDGLVENNCSRLYPPGEATLPGGTASVLAYGYAPAAPASDEIRSRHLNGALEAYGLGQQAESPAAGDIYFDPVCILPEGLPDQAGELTGLMNAIFVPEIRYEAQFLYGEGLSQQGAITLTWDGETDDSTLRDCFLEITNSGKMIPGSGRSIEYMIARLYRRMKTYAAWDNTQVEYTHSGVAYPAMQGNGNPLTWADLYNGLRNLIIERIEALDGEGLTLDKVENTAALADDALRNYPGNLGLPDGAAILRWNGNRFYPVEDTPDEMADGVAPVTSYCFPPRLWYFSNSTISTASRDQSGLYTSDNEEWTDILEQYTYGKTISGSTLSVALDSPMQFSCGMLVSGVSAAAAELDDGDGDPSTKITVTGSTFPITGVIIGSQHRLNFDFTPKDDSQAHFLYDDCISDIYVSPVGGTADEFRTFVSQTPVGEDVYFCLELRNESGQSFVGADGIVLPGNKFYLVGSIEAPDPQTSAFERVFQQDHATTINCIINSLAEAHNAIPNLEQAHIVLGIRISVDWVMPTPSHIILS